VPTAIGVALAGALGALARYGVDGLVGRDQEGGFPWGTFTVNVSGSFLLGLLLAALAPGWLRSSATIGFLGAYTTFSTFTFQSYRLLDQGALGLALVNLLGSCAVGLLAVWLGIAAGRAL
jgi:CrcB protein